MMGALSSFLASILGIASIFASPCLSIGDTAVANEQTPLDRLPDFFILNLTAHQAVLDKPSSTKSLSNLKLQHFNVQMALHGQISQLETRFRCLLIAYSSSDSEDARYNLAKEIQIEHKGLGFLLSQMAQLKNTYDSIYFSYARSNATAATAANDAKLSTFKQMYLCQESIFLGWIVGMFTQDRMEAWWESWLQRKAAYETAHHGFLIFQQELLSLNHAAGKVEALISSMESLARELSRQEKGWWLYLKQLYWSLLQKQSMENKRRAERSDGRRKRLCQWYQMNIVKHLLLQDPEDPRTLEISQSCDSGFQHTCE